ncbi:TPA: type III secretion system export apparatus switch protein Spa40/SpaS, partial [Shigella flexneri]|nr:type III secretion system export apparatus switch protein Spa40/SpaS [Shigella flexneri]
FKKIFSIKTIKEFFKSILLLIILALTTYFFWINDRKIIFSQVFSSVDGLYLIWGRLFKDIILFFLAFSILVIILDFVIEFILYMKDMMMDKQEIKREYIEQEG